MVHASDVNWTSIGHRLLGYRLVKNLSIDELAKRCDIKPAIIVHIEKGQPYKSLNVLWEISDKEKINIDWLLHGNGEYFVHNPELLPETVISKRGAGIRRSNDRAAAEEGQFTGDTLEFVLAVDAYKRHNSKPFPTLTELFDLIRGLGYRKTAQATINPNKTSKI